MVLCATLFIFGKRQSRMLAATSTSDLQRSRRLLFITDRATKQQFLVDSGASVSIYPASARVRRAGPTTTMLAAANGTQSVHTATALSSWISAWADPSRGRL